MNFPLIPLPVYNPEKTRGKHLGNNPYDSQQDDSDNTVTRSHDWSKCLDENPLPRSEPAGRQTDETTH